MPLSLGWWQRTLGAELPWGGEGVGERPLTGLSIDSRSVAPGELFVAIPGTRFDGNEFVGGAVAAGCAGVLVERPPAAPPGVPVLVVPDTMAALARAAGVWRRQVDPVVVGVTGSSGKTTVKEMIAACLGTRFRVHATRGNLNNHLGVPLTLLRMAEDCQVAVVEMGMNHSGEIAALAAVAGPRVGVVTNVQPAHMGAFTSLEGVARAKGELPAGLPPDGVAVLPRESPFFELLRQLNRGGTVTFGAGAGADYWLAERIVEEAGSRIRVRHGHRELIAHLPYGGQHVAVNALAASAAAVAAGMEFGAVAEGLARFRLPPGRGEIHRAGGGWVVVDDTYNANPGSITAALHALAEHPAAGRKVAVLGDVLELGEHAEALHRGLAETVVGAGIDLLLTAGPGMGALHREALRSGGVTCDHREDPAQWLGRIAPRLHPGDLILVKGSRGMKMERIVQDLLG